MGLYFMVMDATYLVLNIYVVCFLFQKCSGAQLDRYVDSAIIGSTACHCDVLMLFFPDRHKNVCLGHVAG